jgi:hypothetical protein
VTTDDEAASKKPSAAEAEAEPITPEVLGPGQRWTPSAAELQAVRERIAEVLTAKGGIIDYLRGGERPLPDSGITRRITAGLHDLDDSYAYIDDIARRPECKPNSAAYFTGKMLAQWNTDGRADYLAAKERERERIEQERRRQEEAQDDWERRRREYAQRATTPPTPATRPKDRRAEIEEELAFQRREAEQNPSAKIRQWAADRAQELEAELATA